MNTWNPDINAFNKLVKKTNEFKDILPNHRQLLYHPTLTRDGDLFFLSAPFRKIDACSSLIFQNKQDFFHHSIETDVEGNIWAPSYIYPQSAPIEKVGRGIPSEGGFLDDAIVKLSPDGKIIFEKSVFQIFIDNGLEYLSLIHISEPTRPY